MAEAPEELRAYVLKVFPARKEWADSFGWSSTPEDFNFWRDVHTKNWSDALEELAEQRRG